MDVKGRAQTGQTPVRLKTDAVCDGGHSRSSIEAAVMGAEQRAVAVWVAGNTPTSVRRKSGAGQPEGIPVTRAQVLAAYHKVKRNAGSAGIDRQSIIDFSKNLTGNLHRIWCRMASGSYFPPPVMEAEILKDDGKKRKLGIPTVSDRIAQQVITTYLEPRFEAIFSDSSFGYRPKRSPHQAVECVRVNTQALDWVIDMDIKNFFGTVSHRLLLKALRRHVRKEDEEWVMLYIERWLKAPSVSKNGEITYPCGKGTPQGSVISPLLSNIFLHTVFDRWMEINSPVVKFVRYADDVIIHCISFIQAEFLLKQVTRRFADCGLEIHSGKTKIAYCRKDGRKKDHPVVSFDFLGFTFKPRTTKTNDGRLFLSFAPAISRKKVMKIAKFFKEEKMLTSPEVGIQEIADKYNPKIRGWINYYGKFRWYDMKKLFRRFNRRLALWARKRYKRFKKSMRKANKWLYGLAKSRKDLFLHWKTPIFATA